MAKLTEDQILLIKETYKEIGTYSGVAKKLGFSSTTVKKYVAMEVENPKEEKEIIRFNFKIRPVEDIDFNFPLSVWTSLTEKEKEGVKILQKEI